MAQFINKLSTMKRSLPGRLLTVAVYAAMIALILVFFSGNGEFIYEAF